MRIYLLCLLIVLPLQAMRNEQPPQKLTIIDLDHLSKEKFMEMTDEQKWKLHEDSRELVRLYLKTVHDKNERMARVQCVLECTIADLETDITHLQLRIIKKNP